MAKKLKIYLYYVVEFDKNLCIYAYDMKQANSMIEMYEKNNHKNAMFLKISRTKKNIEAMENVVKKLGSEEEVIKREIEMLTYKRGL